MPSTLVIPQNDKGNENTLPKQQQRLCRSPHPYSRKRDELHPGDSKLANHLFSAATTSQLGSKHTYFDANHRKRRKNIRSPSDSGTEADDEAGGFLRLPAPPAKLRKGLKDDPGNSSPLLTPSHIDADGRKLGLDSGVRRRRSPQSPAFTDEETIKIRQKFTRKRRAELIRRATETILLCVVGCVAVQKDVEWISYLWAKGTPGSADSLTHSRTENVLPIVLSHAAVIVTLYAIYPIRIMYNNHKRNLSQERSRLYIHIPAAFDPAPLLYPIVIPAVIAISLSHADLAVLLPNLLLSIASIPSKIIPLSNDVPWYSSFHWMLSAAPILVLQMPTSYRESTPAGVEVPVPSSLCVEQLMLLYPLHQTLLPILGYLTTTSLLPAELQLLSVSMINLLILSSSPQAVILKSLLWMGGLSLLLFCGRPLSWVVTIVRIPSWRFRRPRNRPHGGSVLIDALGECVGRRLNRWGLISAGSDGSESDEPKIHRRTLSTRPKNRQGLKTNAHKTDTSESFSLATPGTTTPAAARGDESHFAFSGSNGMLKSPQDGRRRRYTLLSYIRTPPDSPDQTSKLDWTLQAAKSWSFRSLTAAQATIVKWALALYVYAVAVAVIAVPVRLYVGQQALHNQEPVGWALGYLLGDLPVFRHFTETWNLDSWICLPSKSDVHFTSSTIAWNNCFHESSMGAANTRLMICLYCLGIIVLGLTIVLHLSATVEVDTRRKVFHGMMVLMFLPTIFVDPIFISLALILILAIFLLLDLFRASQLPPLSKPLTYFLAPYVDGRDHRGPVIVSHIFLLIGCAVPLWLSLADTKRIGAPPWEGWVVSSRSLSMISGVICVGMGDAAASLIGRRYGRRRWCWSGGKSLEGSFAFTVAVVLGLTFARWWLLLGGWKGDSGDSWQLFMGKTWLAAIGASLTEAVLTGGNDNVVVPVVLWLLVRGLGL